MNDIISFLKANNIAYEITEFGISYEGFYSWYFISNSKYDNPDEVIKVINNKIKH